MQATITSPIYIASIAIKVDFFYKINRYTPHIYIIYISNVFSSLFFFLFCSNDEKKKKTIEYYFTKMARVHSLLAFAEMANDTFPNTNRITPRTTNDACAT